MATPSTTAPEQSAPPAPKRDAAGDVEQGALLDAIEWFINNDPRVAVIRHPHVEELFRSRQEASPEEAAAFRFDSAEDRLAIGIHQALAAHDTEEELHDWISQLLTALDEARQVVEGMTEEYDLDVSPEASAAERAAKLPGAAERNVFLTACWLEVLCTAEARVLGWLYQSLYGRAFRPDNFAHG